jgi:hypothetical protein
MNKNAAKQLSGSFRGIFKFKTRELARSGQVRVGGGQVKYQFT